MANTANQIDVIPVQVGGLQSLQEYEIVIDTINTDLDIQTPIAGNRLWVVGICLAESNAVNLTFKSVNPTTLVASKTRTYELAANQGFTGFIDFGFYFCTAQGEKLTIQSSVAIGDAVGKNFVLSVGESPRFRRA